MNSCHECRLNIKGESVACDLCKMILCRTCSQITSTEIRALELKERVMRFYCTLCLQKIDVLDSSQEMTVAHQGDAIVARVEQILEQKMRDMYLAVDGLQAQFKAMKESNIDLVKLLTSLPPPAPLPGKEGSQQKLPQRTYSTMVKENMQKNRVENVAKAHANKQPAPSGIDKLRSASLNSTNKEHLSSHNNSGCEPENEAGGFIEIKRRHRNRKKASIGTANESKVSEGGSGVEFEARRQGNGGDKKVWLFVSRAKDHVSEQTVKDYLLRKLSPDDDVVVKYLETRTKFIDNKCFLVGVNPARKEEIYETGFWPRGIRFDRFDFRRGQHFLDSQRCAEVQK